MTVPPAEKMHGSHSEPPGSDGGGNLIARLQQKTPALERKTDNDSAKQDELAHHLAAIVESSDDAIVSKTLDGVIKSWNPGAQRIFGWSANEAIGKSLTLIIPPERLDEETHILETLRGGGSIERFETIRQAKDAVLVWLLWYNRKRMHSTLHYASPVEFEHGWKDALMEAAA